MQHNKELKPVLEQAFAETDPVFERNTKAVVVIHKGQLVAEKYAPGIDAGIIKRTVGGDFQDYFNFTQRRLFLPLGIHSATNELPRSKLTGYRCQSAKTMPIDDHYGASDTHHPDPLRTCLS